MVAYKIAKAIRKLSECRIMHRNICMENILIKKRYSRANKRLSLSKEIKIQIAGFDLSKYLAKDESQVV